MSKRVAWSCDFAQCEVSGNQGMRAFMAFGSPLAGDPKDLPVVGLFTMYLAALAATEGSHFPQSVQCGSCIVSRD